jgi:cysteine desulfurase
LLSACSSGKVRKIHTVLKAMGYGEDEVKSAIRIPLGRDSTIQEVKKFVSIWAELLQKSKIKVA